MVVRSWLLLICFVGGRAAIDAGEPASELPYRCNDLVVIGRVTTLGGENIPAPALPNWQSRWQLQVQIGRVIRGSERRSVVSATGVSHGQIREDRNFLAVLRPVEGGEYIL